MEIILILLLALLLLRPHFRRATIQRVSKFFQEKHIFSFYKICAGQVRCEVGIFMMWFVTCEWWGWSRLVCLSLDDGHQIYFLLRVLINEHCYKKHCHTEQSEALICEVMMLELTFHWRSHLKCMVDCQNRNITKTRLCHNFKLLTFQSLIINGFEFAPKSNSLLQLPAKLLNMSNVWMLLVLQIHTSVLLFRSLLINKSYWHLDSSGQRVTSTRVRMISCGALNQTAAICWLE